MTEPTRLDFSRIHVDPDYRLPSRSLASIKRHQASGFDVIRSLNQAEHDRLAQRRADRLARIGIGLATLAVLAGLFVLVLQPIASWLAS